ncbi:MAG TPA: MDR family MFS transporter [Polyangiaceae bacterium]|nr:MDR family MFS transporter [Polyangiaceae bacterium]
MDGSEIAPHAKRTLLGVLLALFLGALDQTIVATALPRIVEELHGLSRYTWTATAYLLGSTVMVPIYGKLADMHSRRTIELGAVGVFLVGSALCGLAGIAGPLPILGDAMNQLIVFRGIQGLGAAGLFAMAFIIIADLFPPAVRGRYQGLVGATFGLASVLGPLAGGYLTDHGGSLVAGVSGWRWVFYVNLPIGLVSLGIVARMPPLVPEGAVRRLDVPSTLLLTAGIVPLVLGLSLDPASLGGGAPLRLALFAATAVMLVVFSVRSLRIEHPIIDLRLFDNRVVAIASAALFLFGAVMFGVVIFLPLFLVNVVGVSATRAGISLIPLSLGLVFGSVVGGQLTTRFGRYKPLMLIGESVLLVGAVLLARMPVDVSYGRVTAYMVLCGAGLGPTFPLFPLAVQNAVDSSKIGQSTSVAQFFRQIGGLVGAAGLGALLGFGLVGALRAELSGVPGGAVAVAAPVRGQGVDVLLAKVRASVGTEMSRRLAAVGDAARAGDGELLERAVLDDDAGTRRRAREVLAAPEERRPSLMPALRAEFDRETEQIMQRVANGIRVAFAVAVTRVYACVAVLVALGWLVTWLLPELPLRKTHR